jgi:hypothetical protein
MDMHIKVYLIKFCEALYDPYVPPRPPSPPPPEPVLVATPQALEIVDIVPPKPKLVLKINSSIISNAQEVFIVRKYK